MELADLRIWVVFSAFGLMVVLGAIVSWARSRATQRLRAALDAYAERELAANGRSGSSGNVAAALPGFKRRSYAFSKT